jgi:alpha-N-arabinofuranosidase
MKPSFFRLPGGNNLEGQTVATRWQWNNTVNTFNPTSAWSIFNAFSLRLVLFLTDLDVWETGDIQIPSLCFLCFLCGRKLITLSSGLGLLEYLYWCEDVGMEPIMAVWSGFALGGISVPENELQPYIQQAIDQVY